MTALAEALLAAQRQGIAALAKPFIAGSLNEEQVLNRLQDMGCTDPTDLNYLLHAWETIQEFGAPAPAAPKAESPDPETEPATERQMAFLASLADSKGFPAPDGPLTKAQASQAITELKNGSYDPDKWRAPF